MSALDISQNLESPSVLYLVPSEEAASEDAIPPATGSIFGAPSSPFAELGEESPVTRPFDALVRWPTINEHTYQTRPSPRLSASMPIPETYREGYGWEDAPKKAPKEVEFSNVPGPSSRKTSRTASLTRRNTVRSSFSISRRSTGRSSVSTMARGIVKGLPDLRMFIEKQDAAPKRKRAVSIVPSKKDTADSATSKKEATVKSKKAKNDPSPPSENSVKDCRGLNDHIETLKMPMPSEFPDLPPRSRSPISSTNFVGAIRRPHSPKTPFPVDVESSHYLVPKITTIPETIQIVPPNDDPVKAPYSHLKLSTDSPSKDSPAGDSPGKGSVRGPGHFRSASSRSAKKLGIAKRERSVEKQPSKTGTPDKSKKARGWLGPTPSPYVGSEAELNRFAESVKYIQPKPRAGSKASLGTLFKFPLSLMSSNKGNSPNFPFNQPIDTKRASISNATASGYRRRSGSISRLIPTTRNHNAPKLRRLFSRSDQQGMKSTLPVASPFSDSAFTTFRYNPLEATRIPTPPLAPIGVEFNTGDMFTDTQRRIEARPTVKAGGLWDSDTLLMSQTRMLDSSDSEPESPNEIPLARTAVSSPAMPTGTEEWFRVQTLDEEENDTGQFGRLEKGLDVSREQFDWIVPDHLPGSPLCPISPKHKSGGKGICVYHGRNKTHKGEADWGIRDLSEGIRRFS